MYQYPKQLLNIPQQIQAYTSAGMVIPSMDEAEQALETIGYYRLRGYCYHLYDNGTKRYALGTRFSDVLSLYRFDSELSNLLFGILKKIEVALRARLVQSLLVYNDALILNDPSAFQDKKLFWQNHASLTSEIVRSSDVFIAHNLNNHEGAIPLWAAVEVMSYGTLSKTIKNLKTGANSAFSTLASYYKYPTVNGNLVKPSKDMLTSWIHATSILRNICAHNSRIYNRSINTVPVLIQADCITPRPRYNGLYQIILSIKYLRPTDDDWHEFERDFQALMQKYPIADISKLNFPADWASHFIV